MILGVPGASTKTLEAQTALNAWGHTKLRSVFHLGEQMTLTHATQWAFCRGVWMQGGQILPLSFTEIILFLLAQPANVCGTSALCMTVSHEKTRKVVVAHKQLSV